MATDYNRVSSHIGFFDISSWEVMGMQAEYGRKVFGRALNSTLKKYNKWASRQMKAAISKEIGLPQKALNSRVRSGKKFISGGVGMRIWVGLNPVAFHNAGKLNQSKKPGGGVTLYLRKKGRKFARGAFLAPMKKGGPEKYAWIRRNKKRNSQKFATLEVDQDIRKALDRLFRMELDKETQQTQFFKILNQELNFYGNVTTHR